MADTTTVTRRTLAKGAAWSVPILAVGSPAVAVTASCPCAQLPTTASGWTTRVAQGSVDGTVGTGNSGYVTNWNSSPPLASGFAFTSGLNNTSSTASAVVTTSATIQTCPRAKYTISSLTIGAGYGNNNSTTSVGQSIMVDIGGTTIFGPRSTRGTGALAIRSGQSYQTTGATYSSDTRGTVTVTITFTLAPIAAGKAAGDDISIALPTITCS
ncbi:hypothetical protein [Flexivirga meconopsidis]|uniref:hypothetical protein n=1 Tax=Flexivirga meconopsidis TaxID=2977121 RepID=UPI002240C643|nr:hypothetical protein [Flexivirga meconopsidis]